MNLPRRARVTPSGREAFRARGARFSAGSYRGGYFPIFFALGLGLRARNDAGEIGVFALFTGRSRNLGRLALFFLGGLVACVALTSCFTLTFLGALGSWHASDAFSGY